MKKEWCSRKKQRIGRPVDELVGKRIDPSSIPVLRKEVKGE